MNRGPWDEHEFVFIGGMHRSGTTLLAAAIGSSNASALADTNVGMDEGQFLQDVYPTGRSMGGPSRWAWHDRAYLRESDAAAVPDAAERLWQSWSPYWDLGQRVLVEKTPLNLTRTRFLQSVFPNSKFVIITRHPIVQSLALRKWAKPMPRKLGYEFPVLIDMWLKAHEAFQRDYEHLDHVHVMRFEHLLHDQERAVQGLESFLGFPVGRDAFERLDPSRAMEYEAEWTRLTSGPIATSIKAGVAANKRVPSRVLASAQAVSEQLFFRRYAPRLAERFEARVERLGYQLGRLGHAEPWGSLSR